MPYFRKIVGNRLYLSPFDPEDALFHSKWAKWMNDRAVSDTLDGYKNHTSLSGAKKLMQELTGYRYFIVLAEGDEL
ncbi:MAG: hypothetical protein FWE82_02880, partial [Defluviitaleaceae bacterium]|nr:hypothetical protein [Defluviitaleaceae bacterium]